MPLALLPPRRARRRLDTRGEGCKDRVETPDDRFVTADHQAVSTVHPPDSAAGPDVHIVNAVRSKFGGSADIIVVVGVAAVDDHVVAFEQRDKGLQRWIDRGRRHHHPDGAGLAQLMHEVFERRGPDRPLIDECLDGFRVDVVNDAPVPGLQQAPHHVVSHPAQSDHAKFHVVFLSLARLPSRPGTEVRYWPIRRSTRGPRRNLLRLG